MAHVDSSLRQLPLLRTSVLALVAIVLPAATAFAQTLPQVRVAREATAIPAFRHFDYDDYVVTTAAPGTVLEVIYTDGDALRHLESNWYWVLVPRDQFGTKRAGWVSGRDVEPVPAAGRVEPAAVTPEPAPLPAPVTSQPRGEESRPAAVRPEQIGDSSEPHAVPVPEFAAVMVHFAFDKSQLTDDAKATLTGAVELLKSQRQGVVLALEGHADATGRESYNDKLGMARAENVKRYLAEQHQISVDRITLVSYGEKQPTAPNTTREGRAQNRRVVLKIDR
jgi:outer membrane protein OmpA-like peptidoglycan-associated protein